MKVVAVVNQEAIKQSAFNELIYGVLIRGYGATNGRLSVSCIRKQVRQCFLRGVYMNTMLISGAGQYGVTLSEKIVKGFGYRDNFAYTGKFYSEAGIGIICRLFVPAFAFI